MEDLARVAPDWLRERVTPDWFDLYGSRFEQYRLPKEQTKRLIQSPYDPQARNRTKRSLNWTGYAAHFTETCDASTPNVIVNVETTPATTGDVDMTAVIHTTLDKKGLLPCEHFVDSAYVDADNLISSHTEHAIDLYGPAPPDFSWQARARQGFDISCFIVDWEAQSVTCPQGKVSRRWHASTDEAVCEIIQVQFDRQDCACCQSRAQCTKAKIQTRVLHLKPQAQYKALQAARQRQTTEEFKQGYKTRAGVEGTILQGTRSFDLRRSRYTGLPKTHLQHVLIAAAMNLACVMAWLEEIPRAQTRRSRFAALGCV